MKIKEALQNVYLLADLEDSIYDKFYEKGNIVKHSKGEILFNEGFFGKEFFVLLKGSVRLYKNSSEGKEATVRIIKPGESFAEVILFESNKYPVNAETLKDSELFAIQRNLFINMLDDREFRNQFISNLMKKQRYLTKKILHLTTYSIEERFFLFLIERYGKKTEYQIDLPKKEIASAIGTIPETFSRLINKLTREGKIEWEDKELRVPEHVWDKADYKHL